MLGRALGADGKPPSSLSGVALQPRWQPPSAQLPRLLDAVAALPPAPLARSRFNDATAAPGCCEASSAETKAWSSSEPGNDYQYPTFPTGLTRYSWVSADEASQVGTPSDEAAAGGRHTDPLPAPSPHSVSEADVATGATSPGVREIVTFFEKAAAAQSPTSIFDAARSPLKPLEGLAAALRLTGTPPPADAAAASPIADAAAAASPAEATHLPAPSPPSRAEPPKSKLPTPLPAEPVTPGHTARTPPSAPHTFVSPPAPTPSRIPVRRGSELVSPPLGPWRTPPLVKEEQQAAPPAPPGRLAAA
ncbi:hypothetical protein EMIHUDRAFT_206332 [Emiliania huxleyi CCMP1516]|uniref:WW domain-containing protein n=2 Tax=Emiliania huxleyi TaxID=2903 RepID=A0A0D3JNU3_EMIH1|nr:hypothetical protein EMIHUDRAFT_206332 [Emiliania huxleyi CCMP1516]EOD25178.1 hypothetical protein EMIHUDRAFT_206332 [Emiliania huxleyi CCMP1516]|eukprot:XP_005777607.1 hypothetical protein EMIHUDRAFT_206332 [Emiliania huxleyi CCMP1516]